ncbi:hypothetical protein GPA27_01910 [Aromatoleum toluolicum]|uniref:HTH cro/C1-type domain-containing protein n=1 Tax=Aromatoleum toluolicum TaxID=90060 RepID=A0ABX1NA64_9RHOO|nr:hypothetical protein [Aromatoleum toluolicum]NMF96152.1 hypothetical protein [Aromatoleum toluolicum]
MTSQHDGRPLAIQLARHIEIKKERVSSVAKQLGVSQSYLSELLSGGRAFAAAGDELLRGVAVYLGLPAVACMLMAGKLRPDDFIDPGADVESQLRAALEHVAASTFGMQVAVNSEILQEVPLPVQHLVVLLYETTTGKMLMGARHWTWTPSSLRDARQE